MKAKKQFRVPTTEEVELLSSKHLFEIISKRGGHPGALADAALLCITKSEDYNFSAVGKHNDIHNVDRSSYFPFGTISYAQMIHTKAERFTTLTKKRLTASSTNFEGLRDTALDLINYCGFFIAYEKNKDKTPNPF